MRYSPDYEFIRLGNHSKVPFEDGWTTTKPLTYEQYRKIVGLGGNCGVRLRRCDLVIDIDPRNGGGPSALGFDIYQFPVVNTPSGGWHVYMRLPEGVAVRHTVPLFGKGIEFKSIGRQVVAPGSIHPNGGVYEWDELCSDDFSKFAPSMLLDRIKVEEPTNAGSIGTGDWTAEQLHKALSLLDVTEFSNHDAWFALMCACHEATAGEGEDVFAAWSTGDELYAQDDKVIRARWHSLKSGKKGNAGAGTLLHMLVKKGITDLNFDVDEFEPEPVSATGEAAVVKTPEETKAAAIGAGKSALADINERFYVVQEDGKLKILELRRNEEIGVKEWIRHDKKSFLEVCQSAYHYPSIEVAQPNGKSKSVPLAQLWLEKNLKGKRVFPGGVVFMPEVNSERVGESLNLWRGFAYIPMKGDWSLLQQVIKEVLVRDDEESYTYVLNWLARAVQFPHLPAGTICVIKGRKGIGKGWLGRTFTDLFGTHGQCVGSPGSITGRFNAHLRDCIALFADEAYWAGDRPGESTLKELVTEPKINYEAKGMMPIKRRNCIHIVMVSNLDWVIPAGLDERRFAVFEATEEKRPFSFWKALADQLDNGGRAAMLYDLQRRDISNFNVQDVPQTEALAAQKIESMDVGEQWLFQLLMSGDWGGLEAVGENDAAASRIILAQDLQNSFAERLGNRRNFRSVEVQIGIVLRKFLPRVKRIRVDRPDTRMDVQNLRPWAYQLPSIEEAKSKFNAILGRDVFGEDR